MNDPHTSAGTAAPDRPGWRDLFRDGRSAFSVLVILGSGLQALQILVIAIIMPTVVADIGGAAFYTWAAMLYTIGSIAGAASVGPMWGAMGQRSGILASALIFIAGSVACAIAPDMGTLVVARAVQGFAGGLIYGGTMALVSGLFTPALRTRILAAQQGTWMVAQLMGPAVGGAFAEIGWWRGSFWVMVPIALCFLSVAWAKLPRPNGDGEGRAAAAGFPFLRLSLLAGGVLCVAAAGTIDETPPGVGLVVMGVTLVALTFRLDRAAGTRMYPTRAISLNAPVGLALWILFIAGVVQTSITLFLPLLLQVVHGVTPLFISFVTIVISLGWTVGTFAVTGWTGAWQRFALWVGPLLMLVGVAGIASTSLMPDLILVTLAAFVFGLGIGTHNMHIVARTMASAEPGEERITAAATPSFRSLGTAVGAATAGMLANMAGLGDATQAANVGSAVTFVYAANILPIAVAVAFMFRLVRIAPDPVADKAH